MNLHDLNSMDQRLLREELMKCCGSSSWAKIMLTHFPAEDLVDLLENAEEVWYECGEDDWKEAFAHHPRIGDTESLRRKFASTADWASGEQSGVQTALPHTIEALATANEEYEKKFGYTFIVYATGKSAEEMLGILQSRLNNSPTEELKIAVDEQMKITKLRLEKLVS